MRALRPLQAGLDGGVVGDDPEGEINSYVAPA
jgi:hypothetical protein